jgi:hypothetical protein
MENETNKNETNKNENQEIYILRAKAGVLQPEPKEIKRGSFAYLEVMMMLCGFSRNKVEIVKA